MKLSKLYCNDNRFKTVLFKTGINLILGIVNENNQNDTHNLGKTTLIEIVDYMLLKKKSHFFSDDYKKSIFKNFEFYLELELDKIYVTIKRCVKNSKISIKLHDTKNQNFISNDDWNFKNITLDSAKSELNKLLNFDLKSNYRKFLKFILRTQSDYGFSFRNHEVNDIDWKPYIMELFGYSYEDTYEILALRKNKEDIEKQLSNYSDAYFRQLAEKKDIQKIYTEKILTLKKELDEYNYNEIDKSITDEVVKKLLDEISVYNKLRYNLKYDIKKIEKSIHEKINTMDILQIELLYNEAKVYFSNEIKKDYDDLVKFNQEISKERIESLKTILVEKENQLTEVEEMLRKKNKEQEQAFKILENNNAIIKILSHNEELKKLELEEAKISKELEVMEENIKLKECEQEIINKINKKSIELKKVLETENDLIKNIKINFSEYTKNVLYDLQGKILIYSNQNGYPDFELNLYSVKDGVVTAENNGNSYNKNIKCSLDLAILNGYIQINKKYFKFLFHDGSVEGADNRIKKAYIEMINELCEKYNIQYITTAIYDEVSDVSIYEHLKKNIVLKLSDKEDYTGTLFGFRF